MYRILLVFILLAVLYFLLRRVFQGFKNEHMSDHGRSMAHDQMVEDPVCHTFVPRQTAVIEKVGGQTYCFCSRQCADAFQNRQAD